MVLDLLVDCFIDDIGVLFVFLLHIIGLLLNCSDEGW